MFHGHNLLVLALEPDAISLDEIVITTDQKSIVEEAIEAIPLNYDLDEMVLNGFWRAQIKNRDQVIQLSESAFEIYRTGEGDKKELDLKILKGRISRDSVAFQKLFNIQAGVGPKALYRDSFLEDHSIFSAKVLKNHVYEVVDMTTYDGYNVYVIEFNRKPGFQKSGYRGQLLIEANSLAFIKIEYDMSFDAGENPSLFGNTNLAGTVLGISKSNWSNGFTELNYFQKNNRWYLSHARYNAGWTLIKEKKDLNEPIFYFADFIITDRQKQNIVLPSKEELAKNRILEFQFEEGSENFWKDYNYLVPDKDFDNMFEEIQTRNRNKKQN